MAHRKTPSVNENWVRDETIDNIKKSAQIALEQCKKYEKEHPGIWIKISDTPKTYKRILVNN